MHNENDNEISQRQYAKKLGISPKAVRDAISTGKIVKGWNANTQKINVAMANREWVPVKSVSAKMKSASAEPVPEVDELQDIFAWIKEDQLSSPIAYKLAKMLGVDGNLGKEFEDFVLDNEDGDGLFTSDRVASHVVAAIKNALATNNESQARECLELFELRIRHDIFESLKEQNKITI